MAAALRVAVLQFCPKLGQVQANIAKAWELCHKLQPRSVDLVCLPEMAFTGYVFESSAAIKPYLEESRTGPTSLFCAELAKHLQCYVVAGYPESLPQDELSTRTSDNGDVWQLVGANSAVLYGPAGEWIGDYRKTNLFRSDLPWAIAGTGFVTFQLPEPIGRLTLGICNDLNPQRDDEDGIWAHELADYCLSQNTNTLLLCNAWLDSQENEDDDHDLQTVRYWAARLRPLWDHVYGNDFVSDNAADRDVAVIICNRTGTEKDTTFAGTSTVFKLRPGIGRPVVMDMLTRTEESVRVWGIKV